MLALELDLWHLPYDLSKAGELQERKKEKKEKKRFSSEDFQTQKGIFSNRCKVHLIQKQKLTVSWPKYFQS